MNICIDVILKPNSGLHFNFLSWMTSNVIESATLMTLLYVMSPLLRRPHHSTLQSHCIGAKSGTEITTSALLTMSVWTGQLRSGAKMKKTLQCHKNGPKTSGHREGREIGTG